jgi:flagellar assembly protein FliH
VALEKSIIKAQVAGSTTFEYKAREIATEVSSVAQDFAARDAMRSPDFKISDLIAQQAGISRLESDAQQDKINAQVLERLKLVEEKAHTEGYELGLLEGTEKAFQETKAIFAEKIQTLEKMLKRMEDLKSQLLIDNEASLLRLVFLVAKKLAMRDLEEHRDAVWEILKNVVSETQTDERVVVTLSTEDMYFLETLQDKSGQRIESLQRVKFQPTDGMTPGGCMIETEYGTVNATVEERVERTWQTLQARIPKKRQEPKKTEE